MKKIGLVCVFVMLLPIMIAPPIAASEDYSVEILLSKPGVAYDLSAVSSVSGVYTYNSCYYYPSSYQKNLMGILSKTAEGLSLKLQIPPNLLDSEPAFYKLETIFNIHSQDFSADNISGWEKTCELTPVFKKCIFRKPNLAVIIDMLPQNNFHIAIDILQKLDSCSSCSGRCIMSNQSSVCIPKEIALDIETLLANLKIIRNLNEFFSDVKIEKADGIPSTAQFWQDAMRNELKFLANKSIINISASDIEEIALLSGSSSSGNEKISYSNAWGYCENTDLLVNTNAVLAGNSAGKEIPLYYLVPLMIASTIAALLVLFVAVAKAIDYKRKSKKKRQPSLEDAAEKHYKKQCKSDA